MPKGKHTATVIWIHGLTSSADKIYPITLKHIINKPNLDHIKFILPNARKLRVVCKKNRLVPAWYNITSMENRLMNKYEGKEESMKYLESIILNEINNCNIPSNRIIIGGFSSGAGISIYTGYKCDKTLAGVISLSGYLIDLKLEVNNANINTPLFMYHGTIDNMMPPDHARYCFNLIKKLGINAHMYWDTIKHVTTEREMKKVYEFILKYLPPKSVAKL